MTAKTKKILLYGVLAVGGYFIYKKFVSPSVVAIPSADQGIVASIQNWIAQGGGITQAQLSQISQSPADLQLLWSALQNSFAPSVTTTPQWYAFTQRYHVFGG